jgi:NADH-quinone oxidoreductase subunit L
MFRLVFLAFHGPSQSTASQTASAHPAPGTNTQHPALGTQHHGAHLHDAPPAMAVALVVLAIGSVVAGYAGLPALLGGGNWFEHFLEPSFHLEAVHEATEHASLEGTLMLVSSAIAIGGILIAAYYFLKNRAAAEAMAGRFAGLHRVLLNKYYVDEIYDAAVVHPIRITSEEGLWKVVDVRLIDGLVNSAGVSVSGWSELLRRLQTGSVRAYAASLFFGVVSILGYYLWR